YPSTHATAEWIEETPLLIGTDGAGLSAMPNLGTVHFTNATVNGTAADLRSGEEVQLVDSNGGVIATPSAPNAARTAFNACVPATSCSAPAAAKKRHHH